MSIEVCENELMELYTQSIFNQNEKIYHYTSYDSFIKIIESNHLWLSDFSTLNDPTELRFASNEFLNLIKELTKNSNHKAYWEETLEVVRKLSFNEGQGSHSVLGPYGSSAAHNIFTISFSTISDYLPLWRYYADNGAGISLGFEFEDKKIDAINGDELIIQMKNMYYDINSYKNWLSKHIATFENYISQFTKDNFIDYTITFLQFVFDLYPTVKNPDYSTEKERRLLLLANEKIREKEEFKKALLPVKNEKKNENELLLEEDSEYKAVYRFEFPKESLKEVWIGPKLNYEKANAIIEPILKKNGYNNVKIIKSERAYR